MTAAYLPPPATPGNESPPALFRHAQQTASAVALAMQGKLNAVGEVTLAAGVASTVLNDPRLTYGGVVFFDPLTANAAAEMAAGTLYVLLADRNHGTWTIAHANAGTTDRTFRYLVIG